METTHQLSNVPVDPSATAAFGVVGVVFLIAFLVVQINLASRTRRRTHRRGRSASPTMRVRTR